MYTATGLCIHRKLQYVHKAGFRTITEAQLSLFHNIDRQGTRLTDIAERAALTKQSMIELVNKAEKRGLVSRQPDPADGRSKFVTLTPEGEQLIEVLKASINLTERQMVEVTGAAFVDEMKRELGGYLSRSPQRDRKRSHLAATGTSAARLLALAARRFAADALSDVHEHGNLHVREADLSLFRNLDLNGTRLTDLAARARMTKQSMRELVDRADAKRLVKREPDLGDARAKLVHFTDAGLSFLDQMRLGLQQAEQSFAQATNAGFISRLNAGLTNYIRATPTNDHSPPRSTYAPLPHP